ncbi:MAG TPA: aspartate aminotransferase, partial [Zoogloea sp.]|nr:aspartate aminotransferase [Zoogloea sp.]
MPFDFSTAPDRTGSDSIKWRRYAGRDVIPMWVADMDFAAPPAVLEALHARIDHGVFGYADPWPSVLEAVVEGIARDHAWRIQPEWLVWLPGVVTGFNVAVRAV